MTYNEFAHWLKQRKPIGSRRMLIVLFRHHRERGETV